MKYNVVVIAGGYSGERAVSVKSAATVMQALNPALFEIYYLDLSRAQWALSKAGQAMPFDMTTFSSKNDAGEVIPMHYAYVMVHGEPGEDGKLQGYLEMVNVPYSTGGVLNMALTFNKGKTQALVITKGVNVAQHWVFTAADRPTASQLVSELGLPCFIKPTESGSSLGVSKVERLEEVDTAIDVAMTIGGEVIAEEALQGRELACGVIPTAQGPQALPITEIISAGAFFDYEAKYNASSTQEITPADIPDEVHRECQRLTLLAYQLTGCEGIARVDYFLCAEGLHMVEINTVPGMSGESIIPKQLKSADINLTDILSQQIISDIQSHQTKKNA